MITDENPRRGISLGNPIQTHQGMQYTTGQIDVNDHAAASMGGADAVAVDNQACSHDEHFAFNGQMFQEEYPCLSVISANNTDYAMSTLGGISSLRTGARFQGQESQTIGLGQQVKNRGGSEGQSRDEHNHSVVSMGVANTAVTSTNNLPDPINPYESFTPYDFESFQDLYQYLCEDSNNYNGDVWSVSHNDDCNMAEARKAVNGF